MYHQFFYKHLYTRHHITALKSLKKARSYVRKTRPNFIDIRPHTRLPQRIISSTERGQQFYIGACFKEQFFTPNEHIDVFKMAAQANYTTGFYVYSFLWLHDYQHIHTDITQAHAQFLLETYCDKPFPSSYLSYNPRLIAKRLLAITHTIPFIINPLTPAISKVDRLSPRPSIKDQTTNITHKILLEKLGYHFSKELQLLDFLTTSKKSPSTIPYLVEITLAKLAIALALNFTHSYILAIQDILEIAFKQELTKDGMHISRSPQYTAELVELTHYVEKLYARTKTPLPPFLSQIKSTLIETVTFFRLPDTHLSRFNSIQSLSTDTALLPHKRPHQDSHTKTLANYYYMTSQGLHIMIDGGQDTHNPHYSHHNNRHPLAIEIWDDHTPLFINCGNDNRLNEAWQNALKQASASNSLHLTRNTHLSKKPQLSHFILRLIQKWRFFDKSPPPPQTSIKPTNKRHDSEFKTSFEAQYNGYQSQLGYSIIRNISLAKNACRIDVEDIITSSHSWIRRLLRLLYRRNKHSIIAELRFHCHESVRIIQKNSHDILLETAQGIQYELTIDSSTPHIESSIHIEDGIIKHTKQIYIAQKIHPGFTKILWSLKKIRSSTL